MKNTSSALVMLACAVCATAAWAQTGSAKLVSPVDGAELDASKPIQVVYEVIPGPKVDHIHFYVDGAEKAVLRDSMGTHTLTPLPAGGHEICVKAVTKAHVPTGLEQCNKVKVK